MRVMRMVAVAAAALAIGASAACGREDVVAGSASAESLADNELPQVEQGDAPVAGKLSVATIGQLGQVVTDQDGRTLYRFDADTAKPPKSNCDGDCAVAWPPVLAPAEGELDVDGVDEALVGSVDRDDGSKQVTIAGWPLYRYSQDTGPGDANGQGAGGKWFAVTPAGKKASNAAASAPPVALAVMKVGKLGPIVTDREGMTLYRFDEDSAKPPTSNCDGDCATKWPPLTVADGAEIQVQGLAKTAVGTVPRADGSKQVTIGGWPVYRFSGDQVPCDTNGHGVGGTWFAVTATGGKAKG